MVQSDYLKNTLHGAKWLLKKYWRKIKQMLGQGKPLNYHSEIRNVFRVLISGTANNKKLDLGLFCFVLFYCCFVLLCCTVPDFLPGMNAWGSVLNGITGKWEVLSCFQHFLSILLDQVSCLAFLSYAYSCHSFLFAPISFLSHFTLLSPALTSFSAPPHLFATFQGQIHKRRAAKEQGACSVPAPPQRAMLTCTVHMKSYSELRLVTVRGQFNLWHQLELGSDTSQCSRAN